MDFLFATLPNVSQCFSVSEPPQWCTLWAASTGSSTPRNAWNWRPTWPATVTTFILPRIYPDCKFRSNTHCYSSTKRYTLMDTYTSRDCNRESIHRFLAPVRGSSMWYLWKLISAHVEILWHVAHLSCAPWCAARSQTAISLPGAWCVVTWRKLGFLQMMMQMGMGTNKGSRNKSPMVQTASWGPVDVLSLHEGICALTRNVTSI